MRSSNPMLRDTIYTNETVLTEMPMTINGTLNKLFLLFSVFILGAAATWYKFSLGHLDFISNVSIIAFFVGLVLAFVIPFFPKTAPYLSPVYAFAEGVILSYISSLFEAQYPGIVIQAVSITFLCLFVMICCYKFNIIRATDTFRKVLLLSTISIGVFYLISIVATFFFKVNIPYFSLSADPISIVLNVVIAVIACLNLIVDFDFIERGAKNMAPKYLEWYGAFGLIVTLLWLYLEILRLLARFSSRR